MPGAQEAGSERTLVVNLARLGDQLQAQPVFSALKARGETTGLVCLENFQGAAELLRDLDAVHGAPGAGFLAALDRAWPEALGGFLDWADRVRADFRPTRVVNLTPSLPARLLSQALCREQTLGFGLDEFGFGSYSTAWAAMLEASSVNRGSSPFNLVDLFWKTAHLPDSPRTYRLAEPGAAARAAVEALLAGQDLPAHSGLVGLQLGASAARRQWPVERFAALGRILWTRHRLLPVLLGGPQERDLAEGYTALCASPAMDLVGRTSLEELSAATAALRLLVTNDTGTMHLAAGHGVPILAVFLATAQPVDTGPYLVGSCGVEPDMDCHPCAFGVACPRDEACRMAVDALALAELVEGFLATGRWPALEGRGVRVWEAVQGEGCFLELRSLSGHGQGDRTVWTRLLRLGLRHFLDGLPLPEDKTPWSFSPALREGLVPPLELATGLLGVLAGQAEALRVTGNKALRTRVLATSQRIGVALASTASLSALSHLWERLSQAHGDDLGRFRDFAARMGELTGFLLPKLGGPG